MAIMSAFPEARMSSAWAGSAIIPTARVAMPASFFTFSAKGT
jgi:hypothetical protein